MTTASDAAISARALVKHFGDLTAVAGIDLTAARGTCLGILGPNGAGKTTTIEMLEGLTPPDEGEVRILGLGWREHAMEIRERIGVQLQETRLQDKVTVFETLRMFRSFYRSTREPQEVLGLIGLQEKRHARIVTLSGGQKQRLALGCALVNQPEILFLDEPSTGLDPQARRRVWEIVEQFKANGGTVLLTTHYMDEAERLADDLAILDRGQVIARGSPSAIIDSLDAESIVELTPSAFLDEARLQQLPQVREVRRDGAVLRLSVADTQSSLPALLALIHEEKIAVEDLRTHRPTLEDVFVSLTGKHLRDE